MRFLCHRLVSYVSINEKVNAMKTQFFILILGGLFLLQPLQAQDSEFGDAPDNSLAYPSIAITGRFPTCMSVPSTSWIQHYGTAMWFGPTWDAEPDGNAGACPVFTNQYDLDECFNDQDAGLVLPPSYTITGPLGSETVVPCTGSTGPLGMTCNTAVWGIDIDIGIVNTWQDRGGFVNVLFDWDQNGIWNGAASCPTAAAPEHVLVDFQIPPGFSGNLSVLGPPPFLIGPNPGYVWARFTITEQPVNTTDWNGAGVFEDGETEDYLLQITQEDRDWGDAPDPTYPTLRASNGANHQILNGFLLGSLIDTDFDGQPDANATGDDLLDGNNDEDGVAFTSSLIPGNNATLQVTLTTSVGPGMLDAWFDFNNDGDWLDANEQIFASQTLNSGSNNLAFNVPSSAVTGNVFARFRLSLAGGLAPSGAAPEGEVEDYQTSIIVPIELSTFTATSAENGVHLQWVTQSETDNMGFHLYRSTKKNASYNRITSNRIEGAGNSQSLKRYEHFDRDVQAGKTYYYQLEDISYNGIITRHGPIRVEHSPQAPQDFRLNQNYPNPFNPETRIDFSLAVSAKVSLTVYNIQGQRVRSLIDEPMNPGVHSVKWDGRDQNGNLVPAGIYLYTLRCNNMTETKKMSFLK